MHASYSKWPTFAQAKLWRRPHARHGNCLALWSAANLAGMETGMLMIREPFLRRLLNKITGQRRRRILRVRRPSPEKTLPVLAHAVVGSNKLTLHSIFGPPRGAVLKRSATSNAGASFWDSGIWYYPVARDGFLAMSIVFDGEIAAAVEFFETPGCEVENRGAA